MLRAVVLLVLLGTSVASATPPQRVADLRTTPGPVSSMPNGFVAWGGSVYFSPLAQRPWGLWRTDGTTSGTVQAVVPPFAYPTLSLGPLAALGPTLLLSGFDELEGSELWEYQGPGSLQLRELSPGTQSTTPTGGTVVGSRYFFSAHPSLAWELGVSDGTAANTLVLGGPPPIAGCGLAGQFVYTANSPVVGEELYISDGAAGNVRLITDLKPGAMSGARTPVPLNGKVAFIGDDGITGTELWVTDGTDAGTHLVIDLDPGANNGMVGALVSSGTRAWFIGHDTVAGDELWVSDGQLAGTSLVADLSPGGTGSVLALGPTSTSPDGLFFAYRLPTANRQLYFTNGTNVGTRALAVFADVNFPAAAMSNGLLFLPVFQQTANELWVSDGTMVGTRRVQDASGFSPESASGFTAVDTRTTVFTATDPTHGMELWAFDHLSGVARLVANLMPDGASSNPRVALEQGGRAVGFFSANDGGLSMFWSDGAASGTSVVGNAGYVYPAAAVLRDDEVVFLGYGASSSLYGARPDAGIRLITSQVAALVDPYARNGRVYFSRLDSAGYEPWVYDGTTASRLADLTPSLSSNIAGFAEVPSAVVFTYVANVGVSLGRTDGTTVSTVRYHVVSSAVGVSAPVNFKNEVYFDLSFGTPSTELWASDGTSLGTRSIAVISSSLYGVVQNSYRVLGDQLCFTGITSSTGAEPWCTDGTTAGTRRLVDLRPGSQGSEPQILARMGTRTYWRALDGVHGFELWAVELFDGGSELLTDLWPGNGSGLEDAIPVRDGGWLALVARSPATGVELWLNDGTSAASTLVSDIAPFTASSNPEFLREVNGVLFFAATDDTGDRELWSVVLEDPPDSGIPDAGAPDAGPLDGGSDAGVDAGLADGGPADAGSVADGGTDGGTDGGADGGSDAGQVGPLDDAGSAEVPPEREPGAYQVGCGCSAESSGAPLLIVSALLLIHLRSRRALINRRQHG